ncbi:hypothetical protein [Massilia sp. erpn]|uniref:hypothetical protein n=1 Tax=Massilia sp. erpn TaxID=2738142 RepID=UPI00210481F8|nr:hypothetical protein [Massilia sp. erpn]UTY56474.1 hypothetical protein HPQ68_04270 [Massilia sp. erpn]
MSGPHDPALVHTGLTPPTAAPGRAKLALLLLALAVAALLAQALLAWRQQARPALMPGPTGGWYAVQLTNNQMFYGVLREAGSSYLQLDDVYYVESYRQPDGQAGNRVVSRKKNDWHAPVSMTIPADKIIYAEALGPDSQLARLIAQDKATPGRRTGI